MARFLVIDSDGPAALETLRTQQLDLVSEASAVAAPYDAVVADACLTGEASPAEPAAGPVTIGDNGRVARFRAPDFGALAVRLAR